MSFLLQPYPLFHCGKQLLYIALIIFGLAFLFEYLLEPFNVDRSQHYFSYWTICLIHALSASSIYLISGVLLNWMFKVEDWKIYKEIIFLGSVLFLIGLVAFAAREFTYNNPNNISFQYFRTEVKNAFLVGSVISFFIYVFCFKLFYVEEQNRMDDSIVSEKEGEQSQVIIPIDTELPSEHFQLNPSNLICVKSDGNYLEFYIQSESGYQKHIKRMTLKSASAQLSEYPFIIKTHRTYLVNINKIKNVDGNAQGYELEVEYLNFSIPVSRGNVQLFDKIFS